MRFLADESCDYAVIRAYRSAGHDVVDVSSYGRQTPDVDVLSESVDRNRILLTEDKDFGDLVYQAGLQNCGVVLFRFHEDARHTMVDMALELLDNHAAELAHNFVVVEPHKIRFGATP